MKQNETMVWLATMPYQPWAHCSGVAGTYCRSTKKGFGARGLFRTAHMRLSARDWIPNVGLARMASP